MIHIESIFMDSGAHSLYNLHVLKMKDRVGDHGRELDLPPVRWSQGDFSYYSLKPGSDFRAYCDRYAYFIKAFQHTGILFTTVDVISNPELTYQVQKYFEEEHGLRPVPVVHFGTPMEYVDRYLERRYPLLGVGGLGQGVSKGEYYAWADAFFLHICPESNQYRPIVQTHGFAMTSWELMVRYPWTSVDSATWIKLAAYGWVLVPAWSENRGFTYDAPPVTINASFRSPQKKIRGNHYTNLLPRERKVFDLWLETAGEKLGKQEEGEEMEWGVNTHYVPRARANLLYLLNLQDYLTSRACRLDPAIIEEHSVQYNRGFGL